MESDVVSVRLFGSDTWKAGEEAVPHLLALMQALTTEIVGEDSVLQWRLCDLVLECDVCRTVQADARGWTNDGHYDYCDACTVEMAR